MIQTGREWGKLAWGMHVPVPPGTTGHRQDWCWYGLVSMWQQFSSVGLGAWARAERSLHILNLSIDRDFNSSPPPCHWSHCSTRFRSQKISALHYLWLLGEMDKELLILLNCKNQVWDWLGLPKNLGLKCERSEMGQIWKGTMSL